MKFKLIYENHGHFGIHVGDYFLYLKYALESLGHRADIEYAFCPGEMNIVLECFNDAFAEKVESNWTPGTAMIVVATEFLTGHTFNDIYQDAAENQRASDHNQRRDFWQMRYTNFIRLMPRFSAIWHVSDEQQLVYQQAFPDKVVDYLPHGYCESFATVEHRSNAEKDIDILFTGAMTTYRRQVLDALEQGGLKVLSTVQFTAPFHREDLIARSKLTLNIKQHPDWQHESVTRLYYHICNDSLLMTDQCRYTTDLHHHVIERDGEWLDTVQRVLSQGGFTERAVATRERYALARPVAAVMDPLLQRVELL
ncbi:MAG: hypothetical protein L3J62_05075 [Gammaproteobacteria bacterium]|nr:hypothetical protein [Gammaproteobacteria bacterium]MCF6230156.1 hypothetical protein [Gammaproteobacteria bacterium]